MKSQSIRNLLLASFIVLFYQSALAQTTYYSRQSGSWKDPNTWSVSTVDTHAGAAAANAPGEVAIDDIVIIAADHVVDYNADDDATNAATISELTIGTTDGAGYLRFPFSNQGGNDDNEIAGDYDLTVSGDVTVAANGYLIAVQGGEENPAGNTMNGSAADRNGHDIFIGGDLSNAGAIDLQNDINTAYEVELHFTGTANQTISGEGIWDTYDVTYNNTGTSPSNQIINQSQNFTSQVDVGRSDFIQGTYVHDNTQTYNNQSTANDGTDYTDVSFIINSGVFNMAGTTTGDPTVTLTNGSITITGGQFNGGNNGVGSGEAINISVDGDIVVSGSGVLNIGDGDPGTTTLPTDGTLIIGGSSSSVTGSTLYTFDLDLSTTASLSIDNSTVSVGSGTGGDLDLLGDAVSGATLTIDDAGSALMVYSNVNFYENSAFTQNNGTLTISPNATGNTNGLYLQGDAASFTMNAGTLNVLNAVEADANTIRLDGEGCSVNISGGTVNLGNDTGFNEGRIYFGNGTNAGSLTIDGGSTVVNLYEGFTYGNNALANTTVSNGAQLIVAPDNDDTGDIPADSQIRGVFTVSENSSASFGKNINAGDVVISGTATLDVNTKFDQDSNIFGSYTQTGSTVVDFHDDVDLENGANLSLTTGNLSVGSAVTTNNSASLHVVSAGSVLTIIDGILNVGNPTSGEGRIYFDQANGETVTLTASGTSAITVADAMYRNGGGDVGQITNITLSDNSSLLVGTDNSSGNVGNSLHEGSLTIEDNATAQFGMGGDLYDVTISGSGTLETGTTGTTNKIDINGTFIYSSATANCTFYSGVDVEAGASLNISAGTIDILPDATTASDTRMQIRGDLIMNGGTIDLGASITDITNGNLLQVYDGGTLIINAGTFSILANPALTSLANRNPFNMTNNDAGEDATQGDGVVTIGDGSGGSNTAQLIIAPNLAAELPSPSTRNILDMDGANSVLTINSDGYLGVGGGNIGNLRLNTNGAQFVMNGGTCDITASLTLDDGTTVEVNGGTLNVGTSSSNGTNRVIYSQSNPTDTTRLTLSGGTINVGDGNSRLTIGNDNESPSFGTTTAFSILEIISGTFNLNGAFNLDDANARLVMNGGNFNLNPQDDQNLDSDIDILYLEQGIVDITGGIITIVNPHATSGSGYALRINGVGGSGNGNDEISGTSGLPGSDSPVTFGGTFRFGDGSASLDGSTDGFDLDLSNDHTYGSFIVNNPSGTNRHAEITSSGDDYTLNGNLIVSAGTLDIGTNTINSDGAGIFSLASNGYLIIGNTDGNDHFPGSTSAFSTYSVDAASTVEYDGAGSASVSLPGGAQFGNLTIAGSGSKTLGAAETVRTTLTLESGVFAGSTNLTMGTGSTVLRTDGTMTGTIQGSNSYTVAYEGTSKNTESAEWSGGGNKSFTVNLDDSETLTLHDNLTALGDLTMTDGILADAGYTLTVGGDVNNSSLHTGTGKIYLNSSSAQHTISGDGTGQFENLELDDTNGAVFSAAQTVNGILILTDGVMDVGNYLLTLPAAATVNAVAPSSTTMIQVNGGVGAAGVQKNYIGSGTESFTWPIGANGKYTPATVEVINATSGGTVTMNPVDAENPFTTDASDVALDYYWIVSKSGFGFETANLSFTYDQTDADSRGNEAAYVPARYAPTTWTNVNDVSLIDESTNTISFNNVTYIEGQFTAAEPSEFGVILTYYSRENGNWNTASSWSTTGLGGAAATTIPGSSTPVIIGNSNTITISNNNTAAPSVELQSTGSLVVSDATTGHDLGTVSGEGTLIVETNDTDATEFPGGTYTSFLGALGGVIEYTGTGDYTILDSPTSFRHLTISGSGTVSLPDADFALVGDLTIGGTATTLVSNNASGDITVGGNLIVNDAGTTLQFQSGTGRTVTVTGNITNTGALQVASGGSATHSLSVGGSLTNNGTFDLANPTGLHRVDVTFTGAANTSISGNGGITEFYRLIVNKGTDSSSELEVIADNFTLSAPTDEIEKALEIQNGTFKLSSAHTLTLSTGGGNFSIPSTGGLWINDAGAIAEITSASSDLSLAGLLRLTDGAINIGDDLTGVQENSVLYTTGNAGITVEGGTLTVGMAIRPNPDAATLVYTQSGGLVQVADNKPTTETGNDAIADFSIATASGSEFTMSGGTLEVVRRNNLGDGKGLRIASGITHNVTGGTVRVVNAETTGGTDRDIGISTGAPFWNLEIGEAGASYNGSVGGNPIEYTLTVLNDFTLDINESFKLHRANRGSPSGNDEFDVHIGGNLTVERGSFGFPRPQDGEGKIVFNGTGSQVIVDNDDGVIDFFSFEINKASGILQLASGTDIEVEKDFTYTSGIIDQNNQLITFNGTANQTISGNSFSLDDVTINNSTGITLGVSQLTINGNLNLDAGVLSLGANQLVLGETTTVATTGTFGVSTMIQTNGLENASGIQKQYTTSGGSFTFPIGTDIYSPATINVTDADGTSGTVNVNPVNDRDVTAPAGTSLDYQWIVETAGFGANLDINHTYSYDDTDVAGTEADYLDAYFDGMSWTEGNTTNVDEGANTINLTTTGSISEYQFTAGDGFVNPVVYYSVASDDWNLATTWNTVADGSGSSGIPAADNPVIIQSGDIVTIPATTNVSAAGTTIESSGELVIEEIEGDTYIDIGTVDGTGTLKFSVDDQPDVPALDNDFVSAGGGTVEYEFTSTNDENLPSTQTIYNNLIIDHQGGNDEAQMTADYTINGDLSIVSGRLELNAFSCNRSTAGGTFTMASGTQLWIEGSNNFPANYASYSFDANSQQSFTVNSDQTIPDLGGASYGILYINGTGTRTLEGDITIGGYLLIDQRATLSLENNNVDIKGNWVRREQNGSAFDPGTGTVTFSGTSPQYISINNNSTDNSEETFYNIVINNSNGVSLDGDDNEYVTQLNITNDLTFTDGTLELQSRPLVVSGDIVNNSASTTPITNASVVTFDNTFGDQEVNGTTGIDFDNVTLTKASGTTLTLHVPVSISGTLDMQNDGTIVLSGTTNDLTFGTSSTVSGSFSGSRMIVTDGSSSGSQVIKEGDATADSYDFTFPIGVDSDYTPVSIDITAVTTTGGNIGVRSVDGAGSYPLVDPTRVLNRHFVVDLTSITDITGSFDFTYADDDVQGSEINYLSWMYNGSLSEATNEFVTPGTNTFGSTNITVSDASTEWVAGEAGAFFSRLYSQKNGLWSNGTDVWNTAADGSGSFSSPTQYNEVEIQSDHTITTDADDQDAAALVINGTLVIDETIDHDFGPITGADSLILYDGILPEYNVLGTTFFENGTVEFTDDGSGPSYDLPNGVLSYYNLVISGSRDKTLGGNTTITNDLTIDGVTLDADNTNNYNISLGGNLTLLSGGTIDPRDGTFALVGATAQAVPTGITFNNLQFDNVGAKSITSTGTLSVNDFRILSASGSVDFSTGTDITTTGSWSNASGSGASIYSNVNNLILDGNTDQAISGTNTFHNLDINKTGSGHTVTVSGAITLDNGTNGGDLTISNNDAVSGSANFNLLGDWTNSGSFSTTGTVNFNGTVAQAVSGDNTFGSLVVDNVAGLTIADDVTTTIADDLTVTSGTLNTGGGTATVVFDGTGEQSINGTVTFNNLTKQAGDTLTLSGSSTVNGTLTLTEGLINTTSSDLLVIGPDGSVLGGSGTSYVNGPLQHTENSVSADTKLFPFGSGTTYRPITLNLTQNDAVIRTYTGTLNESAPTSRTLPVGLVRVSGVRHYTITQSNPAAVASATVTIGYNVDDESDVASTLRIAKSDGSGNWIDLGGTGDSGDEIEGTFEGGSITSGTFTTFSDFVLASSAESNNPLPVELLDFQAVSAAKGVKVFWTTASEVNNSHFVVERSLDGITFEAVGKIEGAGNSATQQYYEMLDTQAPYGTVYYRLRQVDFDGTTSFSQVIAVTYTPQEVQVSVQPNPVENHRTTISASGLAAEQKVTIQLVDLSGFEVRKYSRTTSAGGVLILSLQDLEQLASGLYTVVLTSNDFRHVEKLIIR